MTEQPAVPIFERVWCGGSRPTYTDYLKGIKLAEDEEPYEVFLKAPVGPECQVLLMFSGRRPALEDVEQLERMLAVYKEGVVGRRKAPEADREATEDTGSPS